MDGIGKNLTEQMDYIAKVLVEFVDAKQLKEKRDEIVNRDNLWRSPRLKHIHTLGCLTYFEPLEWFRIEVEVPDEGTCYYPFEDKSGFVWIGKTRYGISDDDMNKLTSENDVIVAGIPGKTINRRNVVGDDVWEYDAYILTSKPDVYVIMFCEKCGISSVMSGYEAEFIKEIRNINDDFRDKQPISAIDEVEFEKRLNAGEKLDGALVTFEIVKVCPNLNVVFGGYNLWGGDHLNFISKEPMNVTEGQSFTVKVLYTSKILDASWAVYYEPLDADDAYKNAKWAGCSAKDIAEIVKGCSRLMEKE